MMGYPNLDPNIHLPPKTHPAKKGAARKGPSKTHLKKGPQKREAQNITKNDMDDESNIRPSV